MIRLARLEDCAVIEAIVRQAYCGYVTRIGKPPASIDEHPPADA